MEHGSDAHMQTHDCISASASVPEKALMLSPLHLVFVPACMCCMCVLFIYFGVTEWSGMGLNVSTRFSEGSYRPWLCKEPSIPREIKHLKANQSPS